MNLLTIIAALLPAIFSNLSLNEWGHMRYQTPQQEYAAKLTTPANAVKNIPDGSTLVLALAVGMPGGLARAVADRILADELKGLNLYYQHSMKYSEETLIRPEVLAKVDARCFFMGDPTGKS